MSIRNWIKLKLFNADVLALIQKVSPMPGDLLHLQILDGDPSDLLQTAKMISKKYDGQIMVMFSIGDGLNVSIMDIAEIKKLRDKLNEHLDQHDDDDQPGRVDG